ncbi:MAG: DUF421 domain-containing protein [Deltaproteobacteria bacterium]|nr:DUF421 domain-containing protein [Deltaproteobacteria bacterium]
MFDVSGMTLLGIAIRVTVVYLVCMVLLRVTGRREMAELGPMDLLTMLLLSETVSPAMTGGDQSIPGGIVAATVLMILCLVTGRIAFRSRRAERLLQGEVVVLIRDGKVRPDILRRFRITDEDLRASLHQKGIMHVGDVARAYVEADGGITIVKRSDHEESLARVHTHKPKPVDRAHA